MSWFDEQIRERMQRDQDVMEDSFLQIAGAVLGNRAVQDLENDRQVAREALDEILKYYHYKPVQIPEEVEGFEEQLDYVLRPLGVMTRDVLLTRGWYRNAFGPMLGTLRENGMAVALIPGKLYGYSFLNPATGRIVRLNRETEKLLNEEAMCFYRPLPLKKLGIPDLMLYMKDCITRGDMALILFSAFLVTKVSLLEPRAYGLITGRILRSGNLSLLGGMSVFLLSAALTSSILSAMNSILLQRISMKTSLAVESAVMMRILSLPLRFFRQYSSGEITSRASSVNTLCGMLLSFVLSTGLSSLMSLLFIGQIFRFTPMLVIPSIILVLVTTIISFITSMRQIPVSRELMELSAKDTGMSYAMISGIQKIRLSGAEKRAFARWGKLYAKEAELQYNPPVFLKINPVITTAVSLTGTIVLYYMAVRSGVTPSDYFAFNASYGHVMGAFSSLAGIAISVAFIQPTLEMVEPILKTEPEITEQKEAVTSLSGSIDVSHVSFRYEDNMPYVFQDLSLKVKAGEYVAIVGRTGCGKSTLIRLLLGFETPEKGAIFYDGRDLAGLDPRSLRRKMGVVSQNGELMQGDIYSNITISAPHLNLEAAWEAAEIAGIAQDIRDMPMGMQTVISEGQGGISGGQKQRLLIARAVAPGPSILILDEATSALDNKTQKHVAEALDQLRCTRIVIAHRLSTIRNCDRILVMDEGSIAEEGSYEELIAKKGIFADLVERQRLDTGETDGNA